jgi:mandelate racemase
MTPALTFRGIRAVAVEVPMRFMLGTSRAALSAAPLLLIDIETEEGVVGRSYLFCYLRAAAPGIAKILEYIELMLKGDPLVPADLWNKMARQFTLIGVQGIVRMAMAGIDIAAWDALAVAAGTPLATFLGGEPKSIPAYNSCGLGLKASAREVADEAAKLLDRGFRAVKLRLGYPTLREDIERVRAVRRAIGNDVNVMVDFNQALSLKAACERGRALDEENVYWIEEPIRHDDYAACAELVRTLKTPIQIGENFSLVSSMHASLAAGASTYVMPDLERIGGVSGWRQAAELAALHRIRMSSHLFPEVSAQLLSATPTCHYLEYVDWADPLLHQPLRIRDGLAVTDDRPGNGLCWNHSAVEKYRIS